MLTISDDERRRRLQVRHRLSETDHATDPDDAAASLLALHASDPASVYLSVLARAPEAKLADVSAALYERRSLVRLMGMRRTLFVVPGDVVACVHYGAALPVADRLRRGIVKDLEKLPTDPAIEGDVDAWLTDLERATIEVLGVRRTATAAQISADEPRLRTAILPVSDKKYDIRRTINSRVLTMLGAYAHIVRGAPRGDWTSRAHSWEPASNWWPDGIEPLDPAAARAMLAQRWLRAFGPATIADLQWWTGWSLGHTRTAVAALDTVEVALAAGDGVVLADDLDETPEVAPRAALLPALDPTPMGWKHRDWYLGDHRDALFDRNGNIGPTVWWAGRVVGGWAIAPDGGVRWRLLADAGAEAEAAVAAEAGRLEPRLESTVVVPSFRTPLERDLSGA
ncbi:winged helix DNA-binding domain-containing protein [Solicola gregarius]|uniref:Winged helix DNA-binding domain-containing protein n=1 Tax=Solicola gregarius TaxID=2908642 RepID=A0AA46TGX7_9ACTN|nr:winged helix DNA-binding domain-containing protein [Solicola gregarius]UYM04983.1 winged helix DNA-binding domain-containing protein [Solicola gregarius]